MILSPDRIEYFRQIELAAPEYQKPKKDRRPWVLGTVAYRDRICELLRWCLLHYLGGVLEIGVYGGSTTREMADVASKFGKVVVAVDPWDFDGPRGEHIEEVYGDFLRYTQPYIDAGHIHVIRAKSQSPEAIDQISTGGRYCFSFVDGCHQYPEAKEDMLLAMHLTNGVICVDDWFFPSVVKSVREALEINPQWEIIVEEPEFAEIYLARKGGRDAHQ